jgi:hypothetical protein
MAKKKRRGPSRWLEPCKNCGKSHYWEVGTCPECGINEVPRLVSENIKCYHDEACDGCYEYRDHQR